MFPDEPGKASRLLRRNSQATGTSAMWTLPRYAKPTKLIESCEHCNRAEIPFDNILGRVTGSDPSVTDYILEQPAKCPKCRREILEKTLVESA